MIGLIVLASFLVALVGAVLITPAVRSLALRCGWLDAPDGERKRHRRATPSAGGLAIALALVCGLVFLAGALPVVWPDALLPSAPIWIGAALIVLLGFIDDTRGIGFKSKLLVQILVAYLLLHAGLRLDLSGIAWFEANPYSEALVTIPITLLWIVGVINAMNLLDGVDGLAAGVGLIAFSALSLLFALNGQFGLALTAVVMVGVLVGFLFYNFSPASIFMGDSGSLLIGYLLAVLSLQGWGQGDPGLALLIPVVVLGVPLLDTSLAIARRLRERRAICAPDHDHIHHRLSRRFTPRGAVLVLYGAGAVFGLAAISIDLLPPSQGAAVFLVTAGLALAGVIQLGYLRSPALDLESIGFGDDPAVSAGPSSLDSQMAFEAGGDGLPQPPEPAVSAGEPAVGMLSRPAYP